MPLKKKYAKKKRLVKRRKWAKRGTTVQRRFAMSDRQIVKFRYTETVLINPSIGQAGVYSFRAGSLYDPNYSGSGHQPYGHDEWNAFYNYYTVIGSKCHVTFWSAGGSGSLDVGMCGIVVSRESSVALTPDGIVERRDSKWRPLTGIGSKGVTSVTNYYSPKKLFGIKDVLDDQELQGNMGSSNPLKDAYFHVYVSPLAASIDMNGQYAQVTIDYITVLQGKREMLSS